MSIKSYQYSFSAGETKEYRGGDYFTLEQVTDEVTVKVFSPTGNEIGVIENVGAGFWIKFPKDESGHVGRIDVYSATAQTINVIVGSGEFGVNKTSTSIVGGTLDPHTVGTTSFRYSGATMTLQTIVTPAANTAGIIVNMISATPAGSGMVRAMIKTSAPASISDGISLYVANSAASTNNYNKLGEIACVIPLKIPAGYGYYAQGNAANSNTFETNYEVL